MSDYVYVSMLSHGHTRIIGNLIIITLSTVMHYCVVIYVWVCVCVYMFVSRPGLSLPDWSNCWIVDAACWREFDNVVTYFARQLSMHFALSLSSRRQIVRLTDWQSDRQKADSMRSVGPIARLPDCRRFVNQQFVRPFGIMLNINMDKNQARK